MLAVQDKAAIFIVKKGAHLRQGYLLKLTYCDNIALS